MRLSGSFFFVLTVMLATLATPNLVNAEQNRVPLPTLAKAIKGEQCVEPTDVMRREHMNFLMHQRDETVREGIRGKKYSLRKCIECHATADPKIEGGKVRTLQPFCAQCHEYAAVTLDCFSCHNPTLPLQQNSGKRNIPENDSAALQRMIVSHLNEGLSAGLNSKTNLKEFSQ